MIANSTKGTLVGVAVAAVIALLHALGPVGCTSQLACWFPDEAPYRFLSAFLFALPLAILFGGGLGIAADDLWGGLVQRLCVLANEGRLFQVIEYAVTMRQLIAFALACACSSSTPSPSGDKPVADTRTKYEGRPIADTCSYLGADWLDRADREAREQPEKVLDWLAIAPEWTVADVGAGTGFFTVRMSKRAKED